MSERDKEREPEQEPVEDLDVPEDEADDVQGGGRKHGNIVLKNSPADE